MRFVLVLCFLTIAVSFPNLIQFSARPWLYELSQKYGTNVTLATIPTIEITQLQEKGIDWLYLLGVWELGVYGVAYDRRNGCDPYRSTLPDCTVNDIIGSVFAVTNYTMNREIGSSRDLVNFRSRLNSFGIKLMLDFVPNHSALDSYLITESPELYIRAPPGIVNPDKYFTNGIAYGSALWSDPWKDVGQFNYFEPKTRTQLSNYLSIIASLADGVRCDMAHVILNDAFASQWQPELNAYGYSKPSAEFWPSAIKQAKTVNPNFVVIAEVYGEDNMKILHSLGFDYTYDKEIYDRLINGNLDNIRGYISGNTIAYHNKTTHFLENHDDNRGIPHFGSWERADAAAAVLFTLPGMRFSFQGQWEGKQNKLDVHLRRGYAEEVNTKVLSFYDTLIPLLFQTPIRNGTFTILSAIDDSTSWRLLTWKWASADGNAKCLVVVNYSDAYGSGAIKLSDLKGSGNVVLTELMSNTNYTRTAEDIRTKGLFVVLSAWQTQIFSYY